MVLLETRLDHKASAEVLALCTCSRPPLPLRASGMPPFREVEVRLLTGGRGSGGRAGGAGCAEGRGAGGGQRGEGGAAAYAASAHAAPAAPAVVLRKNYS